MVIPIKKLMINDVALVLCLFVVLGFALRARNLDFPSIGYHNMRENENLSIAQEMLRTKDFMTERVYFNNTFEETNPGIKDDRHLPMIAYHILLSWKLLGENLWGPRLFNIIFGLLGIIVIYAVAKLLFESSYPALFSSYLLAAMPLAVFFSRNLQPESPALFFMLLGSLFYMRFIIYFRKYDLFFGGLAFSLTWLYNPGFLIGLVPFLFCIPFRGLYKNIKRKEIWKYAITFFLSYAAVPIAISDLHNKWQWRLQDIKLPKHLFDIFSFTYWTRNGHIIWQYADKENFTLLFILLTVIGILITVFRKKGLAERYIIGWVVAAVLYGILNSDHLLQENYSQMPFLVLVSISSTYALFSVSEMVKRFLKVDIFVVLALVMASISGPFIYDSLSRLNATVFLGMDVAGESLKEATKPEERIFLLTHSQGYGIARYAHRYVGWPKDLEDFKEKEKQFGVRYVCFYPAEFSGLLKSNNPAVFNYIRNNYHVKEVGVKEEPRQVFYVILEKGVRGDNSDDFLTSFSGAMQLRTIYRLAGKLVFFYTLKPLPGSS